MTFFWMIVRCCVLGCWLHWWLYCPLHLVLCFLGCRSYCLISKFVLWGILLVQLFLFLFFAAGQLGVIVYCAGEVMQIDK